MKWMFRRIQKYQEAVDEMDVPEDSFKKKWQPRKDSNLNKMNQNHLCYHYTTGLLQAILPIATCYLI